MRWEIEFASRNIAKLKKPILIEGLPGIGNVGKIAVDFIIEDIKPEKLCTIHSDAFPHSVFVNEDNLVELPSVKMYYKKMKGNNDLMLLAGDVQPIEETTSYEFAEKIIELFEKFKGSEIITLGGIGLSQVPEHPKVFCTGNQKSIIDKYKKGTKVDSNLYGVVGPIIGAAGLLLGLSQKKKIPAITLLAETCGHPMYIGIRGARELVKVLNDKLKLGVNIKKLDKDIKDIESQVMKLGPGLAKMGKLAEKVGSIQQLQKRLGKDISYIG